MFDHHKEFIERFLPTGEIIYNTHGPYLGTPRMMKRSLEKIGWHAEFIGTGRKKLRYFSPDGEELGKVVGTKVSRHTKSVDLACSRKEITKQLMALSGVPVPKGFSIERSEVEFANYLRQSLHHPVVVKPSDGKVSQGVTVGIQTDQQFRDAWELASLSAEKGADILVEEQTVGYDLRTFVVGDRFVAGATRMQPFVVGDGVHTIAQLIQLDSAKRKSHQLLANYSMQPDTWTLNQQGVAITSILPEGKSVILNSKATYALGDVTFEVTPFVCDELKQIAVNAIAAIPGLEMAAVDLMVKNLDSAEGATVLEVNQTPGLSMHVTPAIGESVDVTGAICDYLAQRHLEHSSI